MRTIFIDQTIGYFQWKYIFRESILISFLEFPIFTFYIITVSTNCLSVDAFNMCRCREYQFSMILRSIVIFFKAIKNKIQLI